MASDLPKIVKHENTRIALQTPEFPAVLQRAGPVAWFAAGEFFSARISNWETRRAYARAVRKHAPFFDIFSGRCGTFARSAIRRGWFWIIVLIVVIAVYSGDA